MRPLESAIPVQYHVAYQIKRDGNKSEFDGILIGVMNAMIVLVESISSFLGLVPSWNKVFDI